jgi:hypothetical protein
LIDFKRVRHAARPSKDLRTPSLFGSSTGPTKHRDHRSQKRLDWHTCMPPVSWLQPTPPGVTGNHDTPEPSGARPLCKLCLENSGSPDRARIPPPSLFGSSPERLQDAHECLRALTEYLRALTGTSGFHRTPPGVHRRSLLHERDFRDPPHDPAVARTTSVAHRTTSVAHQVRHSPRASSDAHRNLRVPPESLRRLTEASSSKLAVQRR